MRTPRPHFFCARATWGADVSSALFSARAEHRCLEGGVRTPRPHFSPHERSTAASTAAARGRGVRAPPGSLFLHERSTAASKVGCGRLVRTLFRTSRAPLPRRQRLADETSALHLVHFFCTSGAPLPRRQRLADETSALHLVHFFCTSGAPLPRRWVRTPRPHSFPHEQSTDASTAAARGRDVRAPPGSLLLREQSTDASTVGCGRLVRTLFRASRAPLPRRPRSTCLSYTATPPLASAISSREWKWNSFCSSSSSVRRSIRSSPARV